MSPNTRRPHPPRAYLLPHPHHKANLLFTRTLQLHRRRRSLTAKT